MRSRFGEVWVAKMDAEGGEKCVPCGVEGICVGWGRVAEGGY